MSTDHNDQEPEFSWERYEHELRDGEAPGGAGTVEGAGEARVLVDSPEAQRPARGSLREAERRPIVPRWARSRQELAGHTRWAVGLAGHYSAYHASRTPKYAGRLAARAPRGAGRVLRGLVRWVLDLEGEPVRQAVVRREDAEAYRHLSRQRDRRVRWRATVTGGLLVALAVAAIVVALAPPLVRWAAMAVLVGVLGILGAPADRPRLLDTAVVIAQAPRLTSDMVTRALSVLGLSGITQALAKDPKAIGFNAPITRDGPGWRADISLPLGVTAAEVIDKREKLASGLDRPLGCVWPEGRQDISPGRLVLWVGDKEVSATRQPPWPLLRRGSVDLFGPFPFGTDPRGRTVPLDLSYNNLLIGSIPGAGKTFSLRVPLLAAALDPRSELWVYELKGTGDLSALERVAHRYAAGQDDPEIEAALAALRALRQECSRRAQVIRGLPKSLCPENKVTPQLAARKPLGLHPLVVAIDECQELFTHPIFGGKEGGEAGELAEKVIKLGRALGIVLLLATQRPDAASLPTGVRANVGIRFCLRVMDQQANDMVLPTSSYKNGVRATLFTKRDKGVGYLVGGEEDAAQIVRTFYVDNPDADRVAIRARALREAAGTLGGYAIGQMPQQERHHETLLEDALGVLPPTEDRIANEDLRERLAEARPDAYGDWSTERLTAALRDAGIDPREAQVNRTDPDGERRNRRGIYRQSIVDALTQRGRKGDAA